MSLSNEELARLRQEYISLGLHRKDMLKDPFEQFKFWFKIIRETEELEPNAMTLSTADEKGRPSSRIVLLKGIAEDGFDFYTNYSSRKGDEIDANPNVCLLFNWLSMARQIRIQGEIKKVSSKESDEYFKIRPRGSQIGAWVSNQSEAISARSILETKQVELETFYSGKDIPRPDHWGGYRVIPQQIEFWQGRMNRIHDRFLYQRENEDWKIIRLSP